MPHESSPSAERGPESTAANYLYWQQHGGEWVSEYEARKRNQPLYHIQEFMLVEYMMRNAPARVLEFGCGVGRHLRNLLAIPDIDVHGYDQSPTMVAGCRRWAEQAWIDAHVIVGKSTGPLPYPDRSFDIVYTAEVLVHVRPEDVEGILHELIRICKGHILHLERSPDCRVTANSHDGCWDHDLPGLYARLGRTCDVLPRGYRVHTPYRVVLGEPGPRFTWSENLLAMYRIMEQSLAEGFGDLNQQLCDAAVARTSLEVQMADLQSRIGREQEARSQAESQLAQALATCRELRSRLAAVDEFVRRARYLLRPGTGAL